MNLKKKYNWLLFDADNTLFDFDTAAKNAFKDTLKHFDIPVADHYLNVYKEKNNWVWEQYEKGTISSDQVRNLRFDLFLQAIDKNKSAEAMNHTYLQCLIDHSTLYRGASSLLQTLKKDFKLMIVTNGLKEVQRPRLKKTNIYYLFHDVIVSDEIGVGKPQSGFFDVAFEAMNTPDKNSVIVIGDNVKSDIKGGFDYGVDTCWFNPKGKDNPLDLSPTYEVKKLSEIPNLLIH